MFFFYFLLFATESESAIHSDVVITGQTVQPNFHRAEGCGKLGNVLFIATIVCWIMTNIDDNFKVSRFQIDSLKLMVHDYICKTDFFFDKS
jgi:hypothetical protein